MGWRLIERQVRSLQPLWTRHDKRDDDENDGDGIPIIPSTTPLRLAIRFFSTAMTLPVSFSIAGNGGRSERHLSEVEMRSRKRSTEAVFAAGLEFLQDNREGAVRSHRTAAVAAAF